MARYTGPRVRVSRRIGFNVFENKKGDKALQDRPYPPGENGRKRMRETDYGTQLKEKQKVRYMYGVMEKQFRNYYKLASRMPGITGENLLILLESRLDNVIYRSGFASSRPQARQLVSHRHFKVNGKLVDIPSIQVKEGDKIEIKDKSQDLIIIQHSIDTGQDREQASWLNVNKNKKNIEVLSAPSRIDASQQIEEQLIVELYSK
ncbi:MAG: 30S ribosomal protein S4 [Candidatus Actinomarinales bacterium]|nr:MAG: 30S ribosomal protein S4 [Candidatus Actinomarinales bacterium]|tara:strand:- start:1968 stop:2582 length:615 start_codon:yes stop_codon:yes gene_type:complete